MGRLGSSTLCRKCDYLGSGTGTRSPTPQPPKAQGPRPKAQTGANTLVGSAHIGPRGTEPLGLVISAHHALSYLLIPGFQHRFAVISAPSSHWYSPPVNPPVNPLLSRLLSSSPSLVPPPLRPHHPSNCGGLDPQNARPAQEDPLALRHWQGGSSKHSHGQPAEVR